MKLTGCKSWYRILSDKSTGLGLVNITELVHNSDVNTEWALMVILDADIQWVLMVIVGRDSSSDVETLLFFVGLF